MTENYNPEEDFEGYEIPDECFLLEGYDECILGHTFDEDGKAILIYSFDAIIDDIVDTGVTEEEALVIFDRDVASQCIGDNRPIFLYT
jgi:hypothetical protein